MSIQSIYDDFGCNYTEAIERFGKEERIAKFINLFTKDDTIQNVLTAIEAKNWDDTFRGIHTLKGLYMNLSFAKLAEQASILTEEVRGGKELKNFELFNQMKEAHFALVERIQSELN